MYVQKRSRHGGVSDWRTQIRGMEMKGKYWRGWRRIMYVHKWSRHGGVSDWRTQIGEIGMQGKIGGGRIYVCTVDGADMGESQTGGLTEGW